MNLHNITLAFEKAFGQGGEIHHYFSPGRVNLIGEHIDYNGGFVFPAALTIGIEGVIRMRADGKIRFASANLPGVVEVDLSETLVNKPEQKWANYPIGVVAFLQKEGVPVSGADVFFSSNLPDGAGLSSSAALEVLTGYMFMCEAHVHPIDHVWLAKLAQSVENQFVGVNCGIMDQFSVSLGKENQAILLNCDTLEYEYAPLDLKEYSLIVMNTNKRRELAESKYNERRAECDKALAILNEHHNFPNLCAADLESVEKYIKDPVLMARARHVVTENRRVIEAKKVLDRGDLVRFGGLLKASHHSLQFDYEVTGDELDYITQEANSHAACLGSRMTGAGFGGCAIAIVKTASIPDFEKRVGEVYTSKTNKKADLYISKIGEGVHRVGGN